MPDTYAKLRPELVLRPDPASPETSFILKDSVQRQLFRFSHVQAAVLRLLDGSTTAAAVASRVSELTGATVETTQVDSFVTNLRRQSLLDEPEIRQRLHSPRRSRRTLLGSVLSLKVCTVNPDRLLCWLEPRSRFFFKAGFGWITLLLAAAAFAISVTNANALFHSLGSLANFYSLPLVIVVVFAVMSVHELAHGTALKHFGGEVREMGFQFIYFVPAFYCNLDDAWFLKPRERILVSLAGGYVQLFLWSLATVLWRLLSPETVAGRICVVVIAFSAVQTLFNVNPLVRLDGYYVLSDLLNVPNLRPKAFAYLRARVGWVFGVGGRLPGALQRATKRERRIYWGYGTAALLFSGGLLWFMLDRIGSWLVREYQSWGVILLSALILMALPTGAADAGVRAGETAGAARVLRVRKSAVRFALLIAAVLVGLIPWELKVSGDFAVLPVERELVNPQVDGTLKSVSVDEGSRVHRGDLIAEMQNLELQNAFEETRGELETRRAQLALLRAGSRPEELARARRLVETKQAEADTAQRIEQERAVLREAVKRNESELENARKIAERSRQLFDQGLIARADVERDQTAFEVRKQELAEARGQLQVLEEKTARALQVKSKELEQAKSELDIVKAGSRVEAIRAEEAQVAKLEEKARILGQQLEHLRIRSQIDGVVATRDLRNRIGQYLSKGGFLCEIVSDGVVHVDMPVPEKEIADVRPGAAIALKVRGYPKLSFQAQVLSISTVAFEQGSERMVMVRGSLENRQGLLKAGMTGVGKILCGRRLVGELATRRLVRWLRTEFWEYLP